MTTNVRPVYYHHALCVLCKRIVPSQLETPSEVLCMDCANEMYNEHFEETDLERELHGDA